MKQVSHFNFLIGLTGLKEKTFWKNHHFPLVSVRYK